MELTKEQRETLLSELLQVHSRVESLSYQIALGDKTKVNVNLILHTLYKKQIEVISRILIDNKLC